VGAPCVAGRRRAARRGGRAGAQGLVRQAEVVECGMDEEEEEDLGTRHSQAPEPGEEYGERGGTLLSRLGRPGPGGGGAGELALFQRGVPSACFVLVLQARARRRRPGRAGGTARGSAAGAGEGGRVAWAVDGGAWSAARRRRRGLPGRARADGGVGHGPQGKVVACQAAPGLTAARAGRGRARWSCAPARRASRASRAPGRTWAPRRCAAAARPGRTCRTLTQSPRAAAGCCA